jgi:plastocyanin
MDRVAESFLKMLIPVTLAATTALAGTVLLPPQRNAADDDGQYPESRFGSPPAKVNVGIGDHFASRETERWDETAADEAGDRRPAGLVIGEAAAAQAETAAKAEKVRLPRQSAPPVVESAPDTGADFETAAAVRRKGVQEVALIAGDLGFFPRTVFVARDVPVRLFVTGASRNTLCIMMDSFQIRKQVRSQKIEEIMFTPSLPGKYRFYCPVNGMEGTLIVKELASSQY